jgi:NAD(P)-dependent dehydrogenase (short-subunit alcohol dehydrogenase family)
LRGTGLFETENAAGGVGGRQDRWSYSEAGPKVPSDLPFRERGSVIADYLSGKTIAITGAGGGIGRAVALLCAAEGANIVVADYGVGLAGEDPTSEVADAVVKEIANAGGSAVAVADSVTSMEGGSHIVQTAIDHWGRIDGVVCVAGILRERMLFNMSEDEFDDVVRVHLKGTFTVFRAASAVMRKQGHGSLVGFTSGVWALGSTAQANYAAAKGGIVSMTYSAALGLSRYGVTANCIAPVARTRMSANVPMDLAEMGEPEDVAPMVVYLLSDAARHVTGQVYSVVGSKIAVWSQPREARAMYAPGRWNPEDIAARLDTQIGTEPLPQLARLEEMRQAAASGARPNG